MKFEFFLPEENIDVMCVYKYINKENPANYYIGVTSRNILERHLSRESEIKSYNKKNKKNNPFFESIINRDKYNIELLIVFPPLPKNYTAKDLHLRNEELSKAEIDLISSNTDYFGKSPFNKTKGGGSFLGKNRIKFQDIKNIFIDWSKNKIKFNKKLYIKRHNIIHGTKQDRGLYSLWKDLLYKEQEEGILLCEKEDIDEFYKYKTNSEKTIIKIIRYLKFIIKESREPERENELFWISTHLRLARGRYLNSMKTTSQAYWSNEVESFYQNELKDNLNLKKVLQLKPDLNKLNHIDTIKNYGYGMHPKDISLENLRDVSCFISYVVQIANYYIKNNKLPVNSKNDTIEEKQVMTFVNKIRKQIYKNKLSLNRIDIIYSILETVGLTKDEVYEYLKTKDQKYLYKAKNLVLNGVLYKPSSTKERLLYLDWLCLARHYRKYRSFGKMPLTNIFLNKYNLTTDFDNYFILQNLEYKKFKTFEKIKKVALIHKKHNGVLKSGAFDPNDTNEERIQKKAARIRKSVRMQHKKYIRGEQCSCYDFMELQNFLKSENINDFLELTKIQEFENCLKWIVDENKSKPPSNPKLLKTNDQNFIYWNKRYYYFLESLKIYLKKAPSIEQNKFSYICNAGGFPKLLDKLSEQELREKNEEKSNRKAKRFVAFVRLHGCTPRQSINKKTKNIKPHEKELGQWWADQIKYKKINSRQFYQSNEEIINQYWPRIKGWSRIKDIGILSSSDFKF